MGLQNASNDHMICRILHDEMAQIILRFIINDISITITSSRNSVRVVLLIARVGEKRAYPGETFVRRFNAVGVELFL